MIANEPFSGRSVCRRTLAIRSCGLALLGVLCHRAGAQPIVLNELQAANETTITDPDFGEASDWIELRNAGAAAVDVGGWFLSDDETVPDRWTFPAGTVLPAGSFLLVWADGRDTGLHAAFALDRDGEHVTLSNPSGAFVDEIVFGPQPTDVSYGRDPGAPDTWRYLLSPTPGAPNLSEAVSGFMDPPVPDPPGGFYYGPQSISITSDDPEAVVRITLDGTVPTESSPPADGPVAVGSTTVIRAAAFRPGFEPSSTTTNTYFVDEFPTLPVVSLATDPANFFDDTIGIYVVGTNGIPGYCVSTPRNWNRDWERPVHVEFFEPDGAAGFALDAGVKIFGGCTRLYDQKSLALYARKQYGPSRIEYPIFPWLDLPSYNNVVLRSSAQDWWRTMFRDGMIQTLIAMGMDVDTQAYRPALVFLNGEYWGIHNLREKLNEHYFADHFDLDPDQIEILQNDKDPINGISDHFDALMAFVRSSAITGADALVRVSEWIDLHSYLDYLVAEIYSANGDWPGNNLKLWRPQTPDGRWRWVIFDMDMGFGGNAEGQTTTNTLAYATSTRGELWSNPPWSTELLRRLLMNTRFRNLFIQRMAAHMSTTFDPDHVLHVIDSLKANIASEIPRHRARWPKSISYNPQWDTLIDIMRDFARGRPFAIRDHFGSAFDIPGSARLHPAVSPEGAGTIEAAGVRMPTGGPGPVFFRGVPLPLKAVPADGYYFVRWEGDVEAATDTVSTVLEGETSVTAVFAPGSVRTEPEQGRPFGVDRLGPCYPNPARDTAWIEYELAGAGSMTIELFDMLGRRVAILDRGQRPEGRHRVRVDLRDLPAGPYLYTLRTAGTVLTRRMIVVH